MSGHFVYIYRHRAGNPFYVGYGMDPKRAASHVEGTHNTDLGKLIEKDQYSLEIAGPFDNAETGRAVETALISAFRLDGLVNKDPGTSDHRFRPYGLPTEFASRFAGERLGKRDLKQIEAKAGGPILVVYVNEKEIRERKGFDPSAPPTDETILNRVSRYWPLKARIKNWKDKPELIPRLLVGMSGSKNSRIVIGAVYIQSSTDGQWKDGPKGGIIVPVDLASPPALDAFDLRGRRVSPEIVFRQDGLQKV